jgi:hypothetical protein
LLLYFGGGTKAMINGLEFLAGILIGMLLAYGLNKYKPFKKKEAQKP